MSVVSVPMSGKWSHTLPGAHPADLPATPLRIGERLSITGEITGEGNLELAGRFAGRICVHGTVVVTERAEVDADITASHLIVGGRVRGNLHAASRIEVLPRACVAGNVTARSVTVAEGARLKGGIAIGSGVWRTDADGTRVEPETRLGHSADAAIKSPIPGEGPT